MKREFNGALWLMLGILALCMIVSVAFGAYTISTVFYTAIAKSDCLAQGYPEVRIDWKFNAYCVSYDFRTTVKK